MSAQTLSLSLTLTLLMVTAGAARSQDFAPAAPAGPQPGAAALLERALPAPTSGVVLETLVTRWLAATSLETRAVAAAAALRSLRVAAGLSQTGDGELGWTAAELALGAVGEGGGAAVRVAGRRDRAWGAVSAGTLADGAGAEAGAGAWLAAAPGVQLWASAPQLATTGESPPLVRPLEIGARVAFAGGAAWCALLAPRRGDDGERSAGLALGREPLAAWAEARDGPLRAAIGVRAALRALRIEARVDAHPVLGETTRLSLAWRTGAAR